MKRVGLSNRICIFIASVFYCFIYNFKINMADLQETYYQYLVKVEGQSPDFIAFLKNIFVPQEYMNTLTLFFLGILSLTIILFFGMITFKKSVVSVVGIIGITGFILSGYNIYSSDKIFKDNYTTINSVYEEYKSELPSFDKQMYEESLTRYKNYLENSTIENRVKAETAFNMVLVAKDFLKDLTPEQLTIFQQGLKTDVKFSVNNDYAYLYGAVYILVVLCLIPLFWLFTRAKDLKINKKEAV